MNPVYAEYMERYEDNPKYVYVSNGPLLAVCEFTTHTEVIEPENIKYQEYARYKCNNLLIVDIINKNNLAEKQIFFEYNNFKYIKDSIIEEPELYFYKNHKPAYSHENYQRDNGLYEDWYDNGQKKYEVNFKDGKLNGLSIHWYENEIKSAEYNYKDGKEDGLRISWYKNGIKQYEVNYKDDKEDGLLTEWYENGTKRFEDNYKNGEEDGLCIGWHENGMRQHQYNFKDGKKDGLCIEWDKNGIKKSEHIYKDGVKVN